ncbi:MAG: DUF1788 domain-containing protein [Methanobrevibacter sp. CfCl-M3]
MEIDDKLNKILGKIKKESFRKDKGLGNEMGYYIFDYEPKYELKVRKHIKFLRDEINNNNYGFKIVEFDLYEMVIDILNKRRYLDKTFELEKKKGLLKTQKAINKLLLHLNKKENNLIVKCIIDGVSENSIVFITGVGKSFPILRSHDVLNNLHQHIDKNPVIMFLPGKYTGNKVTLFGTIPDNNYYRAFPLITD